MAISEKVTAAWLRELRVLLNDQGYAPGAMGNLDMKRLPGYGNVDGTVAAVLHGAAHSVTFNMRNGKITILKTTLTEGKTA